MFIDGIIIGLLIAIIRKGNLSNFFKVEWKHGWLIILAFLVQYGAIFVFSDLLRYATPLSYGILIAFCIANYSKKGFSLMIFGLLLNVIVMVANGGRMPVHLGAAQKLDPELYPTLVAGEYGKHVGMTDETIFNFLGDLIYLQPPYPHETIVSVGDILFSIGIIIFIQNVALKSTLNVKEDVVYE